MSRFPVTPNRELGQHFLVDENILRVIERLAELSADDVVLEIGPGLGVLTEYLAGRAGHVRAVELDRSGYGLGIRLFCPAGEDSIVWTIAHGFVDDPRGDLPDGPSDLEVLELEWTRAIAARRANATHNPTETT